MLENQTSAVKKVPIRIVHSEGDTEKENCPFLHHSNPPAVEPEGPGLTRLGSLGAAGQDSVFCAFTRQREPDSTPAAQTDPKPQRDVYMSTIRDHLISNSQQPQQPTDEPGSNRTTVTTGLSEDQKRDELARDIMGKDKSLADILDQSKMKTTMDLMEGIFPQGEQLLGGAHQRRKVSPKQTVARPAEERSASHTGPDRWPSVIHWSTKRASYMQPSASFKMHLICTCSSSPAHLTLLDLQCIYSQQMQLV